MTALLGAIPALVVVACLVLFVVGFRNLRADPVDGLEVGDLVLLRDTQRQGAEGLGPLQRLARPIVPLLRRLVGPTLLARLRRMIELAGRPEGVDEDTVMLRMATWLVLLGPLSLVLALSSVYEGVV